MSMSAALRNPSFPLAVFLFAHPGNAISSLSSILLARMAFAFASHLFLQRPPILILTGVIGSGLNFGCPNLLRDLHPRQNTALKTEPIQMLVQSTLSL
ncbi:hypothetical protein GGU10DRAFT_350179 [Lentinula aff. detonsa]|uniref:Uncharacterized protein n=1 Tax=Lentinula aff. detonsa TaxID=2804958 RepID=A0AA38NDF4_9AGAR|nr:hypothetical protein GGU10DRAFT_350179 [Lentinula aff. detonsa]